MSHSSHDTYFAAKPSDELVAELEKFTTHWSNTIGTHSEGMAAVWNRNLKYYYSNMFYGTGDDSGLEFGGNQGELVKMLVPEARALNQQLLSLVTKQRLFFEPTAESSDSSTVSDTRVAKHLCQQIVRREKLDLVGARFAEQASVLGASYLKPTWAMDRGKKVGVDPESGRVIYSGDNDIQCLSVFDVVYDMTVEDFYKLNHVLVRVVKNRWDLIAQYPNLEEEIRMIQPIYKSNDFNMMWQHHHTEDSIFVYEFYHKSTPALPEGRMTVYTGKAIMYDEANPYKNDIGEAYIPVVQMKPEGISGTGFGYPFFSNILPMQEMLDMCLSAAASNNAATAVQTILNPIGNGISVSSIGGLRFCNYKPMQDSSGGKPEALNLTKTAPETYKFADMLRGYMMEIYNINGALRGTPPPGVTAGTAIATLTTNAIEFSQGFSKAYSEAMETCMTFSIWNYKNFATEPMLLSFTGPNNQSIVKDFVGTDLGNIPRVSLRMANPLMATASGKYQVASDLLDKGMIKDPETYWRILEGAPIESLYEPQYSQEELIQRENDMLRQSDMPIAMITDNHAKHILKHLELVDDPEIRKNGEMVAIVLEHIMEHNIKAREQVADPILFSIIQTGKLPPPQMMLPGPNDMGAMGEQGGPGDQGPPQGAQSAPGQEPKKAKPAKTLVPQIAQPNEAIAPPGMG